MGYHSQGYGMLCVNINEFIQHNDSSHKSLKRQWVTFQDPAYNVKKNGKQLECSCLSL